MLISNAMTPDRPSRAIGTVLMAALIGASAVGCERSATPDPLKTQRDAMERAKEVGRTMQKSVDEEGRKADEEGK